MNDHNFTDSGIIKLFIIVSDIPIPDIQRWINLNNIKSK